MPWTRSEYPNAMKNLPKQVRDKVVDIANALLEAIVQARKEAKEANASLTIQKRSGKLEKRIS